MDFLGIFVLEMVLGSPSISFELNFPIGTSGISTVGWE